MPIYEYQCSTCGHTLEAFQHISEEDLKDCPNCNKSSLQKLVSAPSFQLKGTGWYATDFRNKPASDNTSTDTSKPSSSDTDKGSN